jgi:putative holliday junction resolvase
MTFLGIDYGTRRVGLSMADEELRMPLPLKPLIISNVSEIIPALRCVVVEREVREFVVGYPLSMDGRETKMSREVKAFADQLRKVFGLPVNLVEEQLSSYQAETEFVDRFDVPGCKNKSGRNSKSTHRGQSKLRRETPTGHLDSMAATIILRDFLAGRG